MFLKRFQRKFLVVLVLALAFPLIANLISRLREPKIIQEPLPSAQSYKKSIQTLLPTTTKPSVTKETTPLEVNLDILFTSQAPTLNWDPPFNEFCEEASTLMVASYINRKLIGSPESAELKMIEVMAFEEKRFGHHLDTNAEETAVILREFYKIDKVKVFYDPKIEDIKKALMEGRAVIIPAAGRMLGNPYYRQPGPLYHMLVIKGYTKTGNFITNDPGTRNGADYIYTPEVIMNAIHDWNGGDVLNGRKVVIVIG